MDRLVFSELSDGVLYNLFKIRICGRCCRSGLVELSWLRSVPIRAPVRLAGVGGRAPAGLLLGRVAASGLLDLPRLRKLGQASGDASSIEVQALGHLARRAPGMLGQELDDALLGVDLAGARGCTASARSPSGGAAPRAR